MVAQAVTGTEMMGWSATKKINQVAFNHHREKDSLINQPIPFAYFIVAPQTVALDVKRTIQAVFSKKGAHLEVVHVNNIQDEDQIGILAEDQQSFDIAAKLRHHLDDINIALGKQNLPKLADIPVPQEALIK